MGLRSCRDHRGSEGGGGRSGVGRPLWSILPLLPFPTSPLPSPLLPPPSSLPFSHPLLSFLPLLFILCLQSAGEPASCWTLHSSSPYTGEKAEGLRALGPPSELGTLYYRAQRCSRWARTKASDSREQRASCGHPQGVGLGDHKAGRNRRATGKGQLARGILASGVAKAEGWVDWASPSSPCTPKPGKQEFY